MRYICIDLGAKRTGLAAGDDETGVVCPVKTLQIAAGPALLRAVAAAIEELGPDAIVLGLPLNMDGTEGPAARRVREFARQLGERNGLPLHYQDERLTSDAAEKHLDASGRTHRQKRRIRDALAAAEILRDFLNARR